MREDESFEEGAYEQNSDTAKEDGVQEEEEEEVDPRTLLTREQVQYFKYIFDQLDVSQKRQIPVTCVGFILRFLGFNPTKEEIQKHVNEADPEHRGFIDFYGFLLPVAARINDDLPSHEQILAAFRVFADEEDEDYVNVDTLVEALTNFGEDLDDVEVETFLKFADPKGLGKINYTELVEKIFGLNKPLKKVRRGKKKDKDKKK